MPNRIIFELKRWHIGLLILLVALASYAPILGAHYAACDDYSFLYNALFDRDSIIGLLYGAGRPLNAHLLDLSFSAVGSIANLRILRFGSLVFLVIFAVLCIEIFRACWNSLANSMLAVAFVFALPSIIVLATWAQHWTLAAGLALAAIAAVQMVRVGDDVADTMRLSISVLSASALMAIIGAIHQSLIGCYLALILPWAWNRLSEPRRLVAVVVRIIPAFVGYAACFLMATTMGATSSGRGQLVTDYSGKLIWFISEPVINAMSLFLVRNISFISGYQPEYSLYFAASLTAAIILFGIFKEGKSWRGRALHLLVLVPYIVICYLPNLAVKENWASYRSLLPLALCLYFTLACSLRSAFRGWGAEDGFSKIPFPLSRFVLYFIYGVSVFLTIYAIKVTNERVTTFFVKPNEKEYRVLSAGLLGASKVAAEKLFIIQPQWYESGAPAASYDEFGVPCTTTRWGPIYMSRLYWSTNHCEPRVAAGELSISFDFREPSSPPGDMKIIDMRKFGTK